MTPSKKKNSKDSVKKTIKKPNGFFVKKASTDIENHNSTANTLSMRELNVYYSEKHAIIDVSMDVLEKKVTAFICPSGCGKSTLLRALNRMNEEIEGCRTEGKIFWKDVNILDETVEPVALRSKIGMVFQKPNPFPKSVYENIAYGLKIHGIHEKKQLDDLVEQPPQPEQCRQYPKEVQGFVRQVLHVSCETVATDPGTDHTVISRHDIATHLSLPPLDRA